MTWSGAWIVMTLVVLMLRSTFHPGENGLLKPEELDLFEIGPTGPMRERFHFRIGKGAANGETGIVPDHGITNQECGQQPDAESGEAAADEIDAGGAVPPDPRHFLENGEGVLLGKVVQRQAAKSEVGGLVAKRELAGVGLNEEHFLGGRRGVAGYLERLKLEINRDDGHVMLAGLSKTEQVAPVVAITGSEIDEQETPRFVGQLMKDRFHGFFAAKGAIEPGEMEEIVAQGAFILIWQIH